MLRITEIKKDAHSITLKLEGRIVGPWVHELSQACEASLNEGQSLALDLADVSFVDASGLGLLTGIKARGATMINCSPFMEEQLKSSTAE